MALLSACAEPADLGGHERYIPAMRELLASLPQPVRPVGTYHGGMMLCVSPGHYVAVLLPPAGVAEDNLLDYMGEHFDGDWATFAIEAFGFGAGQVIAWHMSPDS
jgi:hypothetical protein